VVSVLPATMQWLVPGPKEIPRTITAWKLFDSIWHQDPPANVAEMRIPVELPLALITA